MNRHCSRLNFTGSLNLSSTEVASQSSNMPLGQVVKYADEREGRLFGEQPISSGIKE